MLECRRSFDLLHAVVDEIVVEARVAILPGLLFAETGVGVIERHAVCHTEIVHVVGSRTEDDAVAITNERELVGVHLPPVGVGTVSRTAHDGFRTARHQPVLLLGIEEAAVFLEVHQSILGLPALYHGKHLSQSLGGAFAVVRIVSTSAAFRTILHQRATGIQQALAQIRERPDLVGA